MPVHQRGPAQWNGICIADSNACVQLMHGVSMKYLAIVFISLLTLWSTAGASQPVPAPPALLALPLQTPMTDRALAGLVAAALVGLQLRRRQKSLRMPRPLA